MYCNIDREEVSIVGIHDDDDWEDHEDYFDAKSEIWEIPDEEWLEHYNDWEEPKYYLLYFNTEMNEIPDEEWWYHYSDDLTYLNFILDV